MRARAAGTNHFAFRFLVRAGSRCRGGAFALLRGELGGKLGRGGSRHATWVGIAQHRVDEFAHHLLELGDKLLSGIVVVFDAAQFIFPLPGEFGAFEQFFFDHPDEFHAGRGRFETLVATTNVAAAEQRLDDGRTSGGAPDPVFLEGIAQLLVVHCAPGRFHGTQ